MGRWIGERLNQMDAPVRFLLPEGGVSALDAPGSRSTTRRPMRRCSRALEQTVRQTATRQLVRVPAPHQRSGVRRRRRSTRSASLHGGRNVRRRAAR